MQKKREQRPVTEVISRKLMHNVREVMDKLRRIAQRCDQPEGTVTCTVQVHFDLTFQVGTEAERDQITELFVQGMSGQPGVTAKSVPEQETPHVN